MVCRPAAGSDVGKEGCDRENTVVMIEVVKTHVKRRKQK